MTCHRNPDDRDRITIRGQHLDPIPDHHPARCPGCLPCDRRHCTVCTRHLDITEIQTCIDCLGETRRNLHQIVTLAALLPTHAVHGAHEGHLVAADKLFPGGEALNLMSRGSQGGIDDTTDDTLPPSYVLGAWAEEIRDTLDLGSQRPPWQRRPAAVLVESAKTLDKHLGWAASHYRNFHRLHADLAATRTHLEEVLRAGDRPAEGVPCFNCGTTLVRDYRPPTPCNCGPRPHPPHLAHHRYPPDTACCLGCAELVRWELNHETHDQGGRDDNQRSSGWHCPSCGHHYSVGEYDLALRTDYQEVAPALPATELADRLGVSPATIWSWAHRGHVRRRGRSPDRRTLYDVADATKTAQRHAGEA